MKIEDLKKGDKVRLTLELDVSQVDGDGEIYFRHEDAGYVFSAYDDDLTAALINLVKVEPPVTTFTKGDIVKGIESSYEYLLLGGFNYFDLTVGRVLSNTNPFTSKDYELVSSNFGRSAA